MSVPLIGFWKPYAPYEYDMDTVGWGGMMRVIILVLQLVVANLLYADQMQTHFWSPSTWKNPVEIAPGVIVVELNPILAGHPERVDTYFNVLKLATLAVPFVLSADRALLYLVGASITEGVVVWHNARVLRRAGIAWLNPSTSDRIAVYTPN